MPPRMLLDQSNGSAALIARSGRAAQLAQLLALMSTWAEPDGDTSTDDETDADRIDQIALLEQLKAAVAGAQAGVVVRFAQSQVAEQLARDVDPRVVGRGIGDQVGLACKVSPSAGSQRVSLARALRFDLPRTYAALRAGQISEWVAILVARETSHLDASTRRAVDAELATKDLPSLSPRRAAATARRLAHRADPAGAVKRATMEEKQRRVTCRPTPDTMSILTRYLPAAHGIAAWAALGRAADSCLAAGDSRTRAQIMADTLVERVTGQTTADDVNVEIGLLMPLDTLTDPDSTTPADLQNYGPVPAPVARRLIADSAGKLFLRRLFTAPTGQIIGGDPRRRRFTEHLARLIFDRDQQCRDRYCDAPIRHLDQSGGSATPDPPRSATAKESAPAATTPARCPAGTSPSWTTDSATTRTPSRSPPRPATPKPARHPSRRSALSRVRRATPG